MSGPAGRRLSTQVAIVGAGPAGLVLACALGRVGVDALVLERHPREVVERRPRAGLLEPRVVAYLRSLGLAGRLLVEGTRHGWCDFLCRGERLRVDYAAHSGGLRHWVYPQQSLVRDLVAALCGAGRPPLFGRPVTAVPAPATGRPRVECEGLEIDCEYVVGCDGAHGVTGDALPRALSGRGVRRYPYDWLTVLAEVDRPVEGVLYALHEEGFAGLMPRSHHVARLYLQVPAGDDPERWPAHRIHERLRVRLAGVLGELPRIGRVTGTGVLRMRSSIRDHLVSGRLLLAGDAAHVLTPSGAKGMNLAIADAAELAHAFARRYLDGDRQGLAAYAARRLPHVHATQRFSDRLLRLLHLSPRDLHDPVRALALRAAEIRRLAEPGRHATAFARQYVGAGPELPPLPAATARGVRSGAWTTAARPRPVHASHTTQTGDD
ncbi:FAD-dependent monooxygenase [Streptomyces sp. NPDC127098]|uniref:FAD-dependent monooxygenase n=1 Tax=Streptomyces sp. NPDC127098 TaxID=3347137 RepID=UPI0036554A8D